MKKSMMIAAAAVLAVSNLSATASARPFCSICHAGHEDKIGPAFDKVVQAYGSVDAVFGFLDSDKPLNSKVASFADKAPIMKEQLKLYRELNDDKKAEVHAWFKKQIK